MRSLWHRAAAWLVGASGLGAGLAMAGPADNFTRVVEHEDGLRTTLEMAVRAYRPVTGSGPTIFLAAAVHIADQSFYGELQTLLDGLDVVLYEGVQPPGQPRDPRWETPRDDTFLASVTQARAHLLGVYLADFNREHGRFPATLDELVQGIPEDQQPLLAPALFDAWGRNFVISTVEPEPPSRRRRGDAPAPTGPIAYVVSLGADGALGGEGVNADLFASPQFPREAFTTDARSEGLQQRLADALQLHFQLTSMNHDRLNWRNSDVGVDQIQQSLVALGAENQGEVLFDALGGQGLTGQLAKVLVGFVGRSDSMRESTKVMLVDVLARAEELLPAQENMLGPLMSVILDERNKVVLEDLRLVLQNEPDTRSIGIIYGAGHLSGIEKSLTEDLGYEAVGERWVPAITADLAKAGMNARQAKRIREMFKRQIDAQLRRGR